MTDPTPTNPTNPTKNQTRADVARAELAAFVRHYQVQNDLFECQLRVRHARWEERGLLKAGR